MSTKPQPQTDSTGEQIPAPASHQEAQQSYLLRLWRNGVDGNWRASLQSVRTGERHMFPDLESLLAFLCDQSHLFPDA